VKTVLIHGYFVRSVHYRSDSVFVERDDFSGAKPYRLIEVQVFDEM
jgi:hypothetical protein